MTTRKPNYNELAIRAARLEIERDEALTRARQSEECFRAVFMEDEQGILDALYICGMKVRDFKELYDIAATARPDGKGIYE